jgi:MipA family protein
MKTIASLCLAGTFLIASTGALAQSDFYRNLLPPGVSQGGVVGLGLRAGREYTGSDERRTSVLPGIDYQWQNGFFAGFQNGIGFNASRQRGMDYGLRLTADFGRDESSSPVLRGLGDIDARPELGAFFNFSPAAGIALNSSLRYGSGNERDGLLLDVGASWRVPLSQSLIFNTGVAATWANASYTQEYFGINRAQSQRSGYGINLPDAGIRDVRLGAALTYLITPSWSLTGAISHSELQGDARRSVIVREKGATTGLVVVGYRF